MADLVKKNERTYWFSEQVAAIDAKLEKDAYEVTKTERHQVGSPDDANLVSSLTTSGGHSPALDIDVPIRLVPSSTPGHHHLYIDTEMSWKDYKRLLRVMARCGILEEGFVRASIDRGSTMLRLRPTKPTDQKEETDESVQ